MIQMIWSKIQSSECESGSVARAAQSRERLSRESGSVARAAQSRERLSRESGSVARAASNF
jgi:hypothetical protein